MRLCNLLCISLLTISTFGCASDPTPPTSLKEMLAAQARQMAADCYWQMEGGRLMFGSGQVYAACLRWANQAVQVRYAPSRGAVQSSLTALR